METLNERVTSNASKEPVVVFMIRSAPVSNE